MWGRACSRRTITRYCWLQAASLCYDARALLRVILTKVLGLKVDLNTRELHTRPILNSVVTVHATDYKRPIRRDRHA
ncbi:hypothetical protein EMIT0P265_50370 [Pseudomonas zeae]